MNYHYVTASVYCSFRLGHKGLSAERGSCNLRGGAAVNGVEIGDPTQVSDGRGRDDRLVAVAHVKHVDTRQVHEGRIRDGCLVAVGHIECLDPAQVHKCRVRDGRLVAAVYVERVDPPQVHLGHVHDPAAPSHAYSVQPCTHVASNMDEIRIYDIVARRHIDRMRC